MDFLKAKQKVVKEYAKNLENHESVMEHPLVYPDDQTAKECAQNTVKRQHFAARWNFEHGFKK